MPRVADHDERRRLIADALGRTISEKAPEVASLRDIAVAAGVTTGTIQHYFRNKDEMLLYTLGQHGSRMVERLRARAAAGSVSSGPRVVRAILEELLPLDKEREVEARVAIAFMGRAFNDDELAVRFREQYSALGDMLTAEIRRAAADGKLSGPNDARQVADSLLCTIGGLRTIILLGQASKEAALEILYGQIDHLIGAESHVGKDGSGGPVAPA